MAFRLLYVEQRAKAHKPLWCSAGAINPPTTYPMAQGENILPDPPCTNLFRVSRLLRRTV